MPRAFFDIHVKPNYEDWLAEPLDERRAKNAVADANNMAERVWYYWIDRDPAQVYDATTPGRYRNELSTRECADFALVRDVADAHKHVELERRPRQVTHADQTRAARGGLFAGRYFGVRYFGRYFGASQLVVTLDDGTNRPLTAIMANVVEMWERLLGGWRL